MPDPVDPSKQPQPQNQQLPLEQPKPMVLDGQDIPEAFRGKSAKELVDTLLVTSTQVEEMKTEMAKLQEERTQLEQHYRQQPSQHQPPVQETEEDRRAREEQEFFRKPLDYMDKHLRTRMQPIAQEFYTTQESIQRTLAKQRHGYDDKEEKLIEEIMKQTPPELRAKPESWDLAHDIVLGREYRARLKESKAKGGLFSETNNAPPPPQPEKVELTDEEKSVARRFGITEDEYRQSKESMGQSFGEK